jgi:hypothetical protein
MLPLKMFNLVCHNMLSWSELTHSAQGWCLSIITLKTGIIVQDRGKKIESCENWERIIHPAMGLVGTCKFKEKHVELSNASKSNLGCLSGSLAGELRTTMDGEYGHNA